MDWLPVVSLTVGVFAIVVAFLSIVLSVLIHNSAKDVLAKIDKRVSVTEEIVRGTQTKLVDTLTDIARPPKPTEQEMLLQIMLPAIINNPNLIGQLAELSQQAEKETPTPGGFASGTDDAKGPTT